MRMQVAGLVVIAVFGVLVLACDSETASPGLDGAAEAGPDQSVADSRFSDAARDLGADPDAAIDSSAADVTLADAAAEDTKATDVTAADAATSDAAKADSAMADAAQPDAAQPDAAQPDAAQPDAQQPDAAQPDAPQPDAPQPDAPQPDAPQPDAPQPDASPGACGPSPSPFSGALCGPGLKPCVVKINEGLASPIYSSLAVDANNAPHIAHCDSASCIYRKRGPSGVWSNETMPFTGAPLVVINGGQVQVLRWGSGFAMSLYQRSSAGWSLLETLPGSFGAYDLTADNGGCLHMAMTSSQTVFHGRRLAGVWTYTALSTTTSTAPVLTLGPGGAPRLAFWDANPAGGAGWKVYAASPPAAAKPVATLGSNTLSKKTIGRAVSAEAGFPKSTGRLHLLFRRYPTSSSSDYNLTYAAQTSSGGWSLKAVVDNAGGTYCPKEPTAGGQTCSVDYTWHVILGVVASSGGDVRLLYKSFHHMGSIVSVCQGLPKSCYWMPTGASTVSTVNMARPTGTSFSKQVLTTSTAPSGNPIRPVVLLDKLGRIHVSYIDSKATPTLRYLLIGP